MSYEVRRLRNAAYWCGPALICLLVHWRGFVSWFQSDDFVWLGVGLGRHGLREYLWALFAPGAEGHIRPWSERLFFLAGFRFFGLHPLPFHMVVFATEFANLALVAWIGARLTGRRAAGFLAAALWAISGVSADPLAWASAYNEVLCAFFLLLAFHFLLRYVESGNPRYNLCQWIAFLLGFGALETNIVYPALAAAYVFLCARPYLRRVWLLFLPSVAYFALHMAVAPTGKDPAYVLHFTGGMLRTLVKYWAWSVGPVGFWAPIPLPHWLVPAAVVLLSLGLLGFAATRGRLAIFCLAWFAISIAPVLPLRDHVTEYYAFVPAVGLCWLGGWALAGAWRSGTGARGAAVALAGVYILIMLPRTVAASDFHFRLTARIRNLVEGVARARQLHPNQTILLDGVDTILFYDAILDHPFRLLGIDHVYLTPGSERQIDAHPEMGDVGEFVLPSDEVAKALDNDEVAVYDVRGPRLRNITSTYASQPRELGLPLRVDVSNPLTAPLLGPEWYSPDGNHRWMPQRATLRMAGPAATGQKLYLRGYYPAEQLRQGPVTVTVTVNGSTLAPARIAAGGNFELAFALPEAVVGQSSMQVVVEASRTFRAGADIRDLGLAFGEFEVR
jgi:hypothetical protein